MSAGPVVIIPARLASSRLPRKLLLAESGKPLIQHTWESCRKSLRAKRVIIATDHDELAACCTAFGAEVVKTGPADCGSERCHIAATKLEIRDIVVNVQGDEPEVSAEAIDALILLMNGGPNMNGGHWPVATLAAPLTPVELTNRNVVKVALRRGPHSSHALYFSRGALAGALRHVGVYAYQPYALKCLVHDTRNGRLPLAAAEDLEQLYYLEAGWAMGVHVLASAPRGIDTREDYDAFLARIRKGA